MFEVFDPGGRPYPFGSPMQVVGHAGKAVTFKPIGVRVAPVVETRDGKDGTSVGVIVGSAAVFG